MSTLLIIGIVGLLINTACGIPICMEAVGQGTCPKWVVVLALCTGWTSFIAIAVAAGFWTAVLYMLICSLFLIVTTAVILLWKACTPNEVVNVPLAPSLLH